MLGRALIALLVAAALFTAGCSGEEANDGRPLVVVTTTILGDVVGNVVGDAATVEVLMPAGADPHDYIPSSQQVARIHQADLVVVNGLGLEAGLTDVLEAAVISFVVEGIHPHDIATVLDLEGIAIRAGHHCSQPLMERFEVPATARASLAVYNTREDVDALVTGLNRVLEVLG